MSLFQDYKPEDLEKLLRETAKALVDNLSEYSVVCSIRILDEKRENLIAVARYFGHPKKHMPEQEPAIPVGNGKNVHTVGGDAVRTKKIQEVPVLKHDHRFSNPEIIQAGYASMMAVPIIFNTEAIGVIQVYTELLGYQFTERHKKIATTIADSLAHVIVINQLYSEVQQLREREKMAIIGEHAAFIAHHFKNALVPVIGFAEQILKKIDDKEIVERNAKIIIDEGRKLETCIADISEFSAPKHLDASSTDIDTFVQGILDIFGQSKERTVQLIYNLHSNAVIPVDQTKMNPVIHELLKNACDASEQNGGIEIICETYGTKNNVYIKITNKGEVDPSIKDKIFDPFITSKSKGSGLGLPNALDVVRAHKGEIHVSSRGGKTTFAICLPKSA